MSVTLISESTHTAKKKHLCDLCCQHIEVGEIYKRQFCSYDDVYTFKMHLVCEDISKVYSQEYDSDEEGYDHNFFSNDVIENFESIVGFKRDGLNYKEALKLFKQKWMEGKETKGNG